MRKTIVLALVSLSISTMLAAATVVSNSATEESSLVRDPIVRDNDSPLVKAAKRSLASRTKAANGAVVINDQYLRTSTGGHFAEASGIQAPINSAPAPNASTFKSAPTVAPTDPRPALEQQKKDLDRAARAYSNEAEQGPYGELTEDQAIRGQETTQQQQQQVQQQLDSMPRPSRPPK
jgi:hypothetical protein